MGINQNLELIFFSFDYFSHYLYDTVLLLIY